MSKLELKFTRCRNFTIIWQLRYYSKTHKILIPSIIFVFENRVSPIQLSASMEDEGRFRIDIYTLQKFYNNMTIKALFQNSQNFDTINHFCVQKQCVPNPIVSEYGGWGEVQSHIKTLTSHKSFSANYLQLVMHLAMSQEINTGQQQIQSFQRATAAPVF